MLFFLFSSQFPGNILVTLQYKEWKLLHRYADIRCSEEQPKNFFRISRIGFLRNSALQIKTNTLEKMLSFRIYKYEHKRVIPLSNTILEDVMKKSTVLTGNTDLCTNLIMAIIHVQLQSFVLLFIYLCYPALSWPFDCLRVAYN